MAMETNVNYTIVGIFVIVLLSAITMGIIWLSSGFSFAQYSTYMIYMQESVSGLNIDSSVEFNGVSVGSVKSIELNHRNPQLVEVLISIKSTTPVTRGTVATLNTRGITGVTYLALKDKSTDLRPLVKLSGQVYPVIPTAPSLFLRLDAALRQLSNNLRKVTESIQSVLDPENQLTIKATLHNVQQITNTLAINGQKMTVILENTAKASAQLGPLLQSGSSTMKTLEMQTLPTMYRLLSNLDEVTRTLTQVTADLKQNPAIIIRGTQRVPGPGEQK
jgi:phospholipid/cholesterol/gamma-HCH transport system substrate-binding protein